MNAHADGCGEFRALASSLLDGELEELESARLERHLIVCVPCMTWTRDATALGRLLHESQSAPPAWSSEDFARPRRWRFARATSIAAAASAAAVAAFAVAQPGAGLFLFSSSGATPVSQAPCTSCAKVEFLMAAARARTRYPQFVAAPPQTHLTNPFVQPSVPAQRP